jgi:HlyD family secretion protein
LFGCARANLYSNTEARDFDRAQKLIKSQAVSQAEYEASENRLRLAMADLRSAESAQRVAGYEIDQAKAAVDYITSTFDPNEVNLFKIVSPINGKVLEVYREDSGVITSGTPIFRIGDSSDLEIVIDILSTDAVQVRPNDSVIIEHWGGDKPLAAAVRLVEPSAFLKVSALGVEEKRVNVIADFIDPIEHRETLGDGFRIEAKIVVDKTPEDSLKIPAGVLFRQAGTWNAFCIVDGIAEQVEVQVGRSNGIETEVLGGIGPKDTLILHPTETIQAGTRVVPTR